MVVSVLHADSSTQLWPETEVFLHFTRYTRLSFQAAQKRDDGGVVQSQAGSMFDTAPLFVIRKLLRSNNDLFRQRYVVLWLGYIYSTSFEESVKSSHENRAIAAVTLRVTLRKDLLLTHRSQGDLRFFKKQFAPRYRGKVELDWDTRLSSARFTPYASAEGFYDTRFDAISRWEYSAGVEVPLLKHLKFVLITPISLIKRPSLPESTWRALPLMHISERQYR